MQKNMGALDRGLRLAAVVVIATLVVTGTATGVTALALGTLAVIFTLTSSVGTCPLYLPLGLNTCGR
ncbi:DUF2892 domain-containing protein [Microbulbifer flavimaris]|uniref:DUF2892 domain-containing protein n=1 Tax=Microbulbifer flavimaris TaxID=1781068 RepID=A0ABX4I351_9GAMM|nr:hypothetical protein AVO43_07760 [Microbulbifer sp. ZGT114]PCO06198.1 DUF2892 domain-containing protein [Microbulbifer flavimaris]